MSSQELYAGCVVLLWLICCTGLAAADPATPQCNDAKFKKLCLNSYEEGKKQRDQGNFPESLRLFQQAYRYVPDPLLLHSIGRLLQIQGNTRGAIEHYQKFLATGAGEKKLRDMTEAYMAEANGQEQFSEKNYEKAEKQFRTAWSLWQSTQFLFRIGHALQMQKQAKNASEFYAQFLASSVTREEPPELRALAKEYLAEVQVQVQLEQGKLDEAERLYEAQPYPRLLLVIGAFLRRRSLPGDAVLRYNQFLAAPPENAELRNTACELLAEIPFEDVWGQYEKGRLRDPASMYKTAYEIRSKSLFLFYIGRILHKQRNAKDAFEYYKRVKEAKDAFPDLKDQANEYMAKIDPPVYKKAWFWSVVGVAAAGVAIGVGLGAYAREPNISDLPVVQPAGK